MLNFKIHTNHFRSFYLAISYNRPKFCRFPSWYPDAITFANESIVGEKPYGLFINTENIVYTVGDNGNIVSMWSQESNNSTNTIYANLSDPRSVFVTPNGDIYIDNGENGVVDIWTSNVINSPVSLGINESCSGLFVDVKNNLYCSIEKQHKLIRKALDNDSSSVEPIASAGSDTSLPSILDSPRGIFVDIKLNLYVADSGHHRIVRLQLKSLEVKIVAGKGAEEPFDLNRPSGVIIDGNNYLYIADQGNHRIVGSGPYGFRCLVGCSGVESSTAATLSIPWMMSFDSDGNIFVADRGNHRIQKFALATNLCGKFINVLSFVQYE